MQCLVCSVSYEFSDFPVFGVAYPSNDTYMSKQSNVHFSIIVPTILFSVFKKRGLVRNIANILKKRQKKHESKSKTAKKHGKK